MVRLLYFILLFNLGCFLFVDSDADCMMEFIAEKCQREGIFKKLQDMKPNECVEICEQEHTCFAINYFLLNATCLLLNRTMPQSKLFKATKCWYKSVRRPPKESIDNDPCYHKACKWDEICTHNTTTNLAECYPLCKTPPAKSGAINETVEVEVGHNYTYKCQDGLFGKRGQNPTVTCLQDGSWTGTHFTCVCKTPPAKSGAINETVEVEVGHNYTYKCQDGLFGKRGQNPTVTCLQDGSWTGTHFTCVCKTPPAKSGAINETVEVEVGHNYTYKCQDGLFGKRGQNPTVTCLQDGSWTGTHFTCVCKTPPAKSGAINETVEVEVGHNYTYKCQDGLFGKRGQNPTVTCLQDGSWTGTHFTCVCKTPPMKAWAINETVEVEVGQNYTYRCPGGLFVKEYQNPTVTCLPDGSWTSTNFICAIQNWKQDTIYPYNIQKSDVINTTKTIDLLTCMQQCDDDPNNCSSFFYYNHTSQCVLSSSFRRGLPQGFPFSDGLVYYTAPSTSCDMEYKEVSLGGSYFCIKYHTENKDFNQAMKICESEKAKLFVVTTQAQIADVKKINNNVNIFIGVSDETNEGHWVSWNGQAVSLFWHPGDPNGNTNENCGSIQTWASGVVDVPLHFTYNFICHKNQL